MAEVTIVIPLYNKEDTVVRAINSIRRQTFEDWRLIVVDDGSTDGGPDIVDRIDDGRIELIRQPNAGPGAARNAGIAKANSKYLAFLDADDEWYPWYLANAVEALENNDVALVASMHHIWPQKIDWTDILEASDIPLGIHSFTGDENPAKVKTILPSIAAWSSVIRTEIADKYGGFYEKNKCSFGEDLTFFIRVTFNERFMLIGPAAVRYHCEDSHLDRHHGKSHAKPLQPFLVDPEVVMSYCPVEKQELLSRYIDLRAIMKAQEWAENSKKIGALKLLKRYPGAKAYKEDYRECMMEILLGTSIWESLIEGSKGICKSSFWAVARFLKRTLRPRLRREILFVCESALMAEYLADVWQLLKDDQNLRFHLLDSSEKWKIDRPDTQDHIRKTLPIPLIRSRWVARMHWDLIITADHSRPGLVDKKLCPTLFVPHGPVSISITGSYAYGMFAFNVKGSLRYTKMLESSEYIRDVVTASNPAFQGVIAVVGDLRDDKMLALAKQRDEIRSQMGFTSDDKVVMVLGAWGPNSLYNTMGDAVLAQINDLKDEFRFILNVHPHAYRPKPSGQRVWGEYLRGQREHGFIVREPDEDWMPYMVVCDIILTDYTSLALRVALLDKPAVYVPIPDESYFLSDDSLVRCLYELSPVVQDDASDLGDRLRQGLNDYPFDKLKELASQINSYPGQSRQRILKELYSLLKLPFSENH